MVLQRRQVGLQELQGNELSPQLDYALQLLAEGHRPEIVAKITGISAEKIRFVKRTPRCQEIMAEKMRGFIVTDLLPAELRRINGIVHDPTASHKVISDLLPKIAALAGFTAAQAHVAGSDDLTTMTRDQLEDVILQINKQIAERAKLVNATEGDVIDAEAVEIID